MMHGQHKIIREKMMDIESQVCSLELSKRLKELGIEQNGYFCHVQYGVVDDNNHEIIIGTLLDVVVAELHESSAKCIISSAFTTSELLEILPHRVTPPKGAPYNSFRFRMEKGIWCRDESASTNNPKFTEYYSVNYYCDTTSQEMDWLFKSLTQN